MDQPHDYMFSGLAHNKEVKREKNNFCLSVKQLYVERGSGLKSQIPFLR